MPDVDEGKDEAPDEQRVKLRESTDATAGRNEHRPTRDATQLARPPHPKTASIRRIREISVASGGGAINCQASHGRPACLIVFGVTSDVNCEIGAETPNVKDEPRPQRA